MNKERNAVGWFEIYVQGMDRAKNFYEKTFKTTLEALPSPGMEMVTFPMDMEGSDGEEVSPEEMKKRWDAMGSKCEPS